MGRKLNKSLKVSSETHEIHISIRPVSEESIDEALAKREPLPCAALSVSVERTPEGIGAVNEWINTLRPGKPNGGLTVVEVYGSIDQCLANPKVLKRKREPAPPSRVKKSPKQLVDELVDLCGPVKTQSPTSKDWRLAEKRLGAKLPLDYKRMISTFGPCVFGDCILLLSPFAARKHHNLIHTGKWIEKDGFPELNSELLGRLDADTRVIQWGRYNEYDLCWLAKGPPARWASAVIGWRDGVMIPVDQPMAEVLRMLLTGNARFDELEDWFQTIERRVHVRALAT